MTLPVARLTTDSRCRFSENWPIAERLALIASVQAAVPEQFPPIQWKLLPTAAAGVRITLAVAGKTWDGAVAHARARVRWRS